MLHRIRVMPGSRIVVAVLLLVAFVLPGTIAGATPSSTLPTLSPGTPVRVTLSAPTSVNEQATPAEAPQAAQTTVTMPVRTGVSASVYAARKAAVAHSSIAATVGSAHQSPLINPAKTSTVSAAINVDGKKDAGNSALNGFTLQPSDQALAASSSEVLQALNDEVNVYFAANGAPEGGTFPKSARSFFNIPNPSPAGCSTLPGSAPFVSDPRAFYDASANRFVVTILELEGYYGINSCTPVSREWIAVSQTGSASGAYWIYQLDTSAISGHPADYPTLGFDANGIYFGFNNFDASGSVYKLATYGGCQIAPMLSGAGLTACSFYNGPNYGGVPFDTMQPVETQGDMWSGWPQTELWVTSFNMNFGGGQCSGGCSGQVVWSMSNVGQGSFSVTGVLESTPSYSLAPPADNPPSCTYCIDTLDTRISATPVYRAGFIYSAIETASNNGSQIVPGVLWLKTRVSTDDPPVVAMLTDTVAEDSGYYFYGGDGAAFFPALMPDQEGNLHMVFNYSGNGYDPSAAFASRRATEASGVFEDTGYFLYASTTPTGDYRWGDYSATSYDGTGNHVWVASQYSNGDWATRIAKVTMFNGGIP